MSLDATTKFQIKAFIAIFLSCICLELAIEKFKISENFPSRQTAKNEEFLQSSLLPPRKVVIGLVSCQSKLKSTPEKLFYGLGLHEKALVSIKSILISSRLYGVPQVDFHIFVEKDNDPAWFHKRLARNNWIQDVGVDVNIYFHSAVDAVPYKYKKHMVYHIPYRCGFVRMFFPSALPEVDSIIYLDTDMIVTGSIVELWQQLRKMDNEQVIGVARNNEPENRFVNILPGFGDILPLHEKAPSALNSGMLVMNLTKMRGHHWQERFLRIYDDFSKIYDNMEDQRTLNLFAYFDPGQLLLIPCQFNFIHTNCDFGWFCEPALKDPYGVQVVHGAGSQFQGSGRFKNIFQTYRDFTWGNYTSKDSDRKQFIETVAKPLRETYEHHNQIGKSLHLKIDSKCYGTLDKLLFKNLMGSH